MAVDVGRPVSKELTAWAHARTLGWKLELEGFLKTRPYLYHLTAASNLQLIRGHRRVYPAATLMEMSGQREFVRRKRVGPQPVLIEGILVTIRDQQPLHSGNMCLPSDYSFEAFIECLNRKVFFWPGRADGPIAYGMRHFNTYKSERPVILRVLSAHLFAANPSAAPLYCAYNSGSPRCSNGKKSPRGLDTFAKVDKFEGTPARVVEVTFDTSVALPVDARYGRTPQGPWRSMEWT